MKKKITWFMISLLAVVTTTQAQNRKINFNENEPWAEVVAKAKEAGRPIFMDCYTVWCGPCKMLDRDVFSNDEIADYYNAQFVNAKYDMEKGEGIELLKKYNVSAFPTLLFIDPATQEVIHRVVGAGNVEHMMQQAKIAVDPANNLQAIRAAFEAGTKDLASVTEYTQALRRAGMGAEQSRVTVEYVNGLTDQELMQEENWSLLESNVNDPLAAPLQRVFANRLSFEEAVGSERVERLLTASMMVAVNRFRNKDPEPAEDFDQERFDALVDFFSKTEGAAAKTNLIQLQTIGYAQHREYGKMIDNLKVIAADQAMHPQMKSVFLMTHLTKLIGRPEIKEQTLAVLGEIIEGTTDNHLKGSYHLIKGLLLESYGDTEGAEEAKAEADKFRKMGGSPQMMRIG